MATQTVKDAIGIQYTEAISSDTNKILKALGTRKNALAKMLNQLMRSSPFHQSFCIQTFACSWDMTDVCFWGETDVCC